MAQATLPPLMPVRRPAKVAVVVRASHHRREAATSNAGRLALRDGLRVIGRPRGDGIVAATKRAKASPC
ncbi:MAG: hypothetical protein ACKVP7_22485 [Hyphomicrobiaceae bacterium]